MTTRTQFRVAPLAERPSEWSQLATRGFPHFRGGAIR